MADISRFKEAMEVVYGPFATDAETAKSWQPPERSGGHRGRYLWTDAFGVINFITLSKETNDQLYLTQAIHLAGTVHDVLGRTRDGKARLTGATDQNLMGGGLRIGKVDEDGSDGDGQYHHYLTLWMFALNRLSKATYDKSYNDQAIALAKAIHPKFFLDRQTPEPRMVWKIAMDMSKPLVNYQGHLDPIEGFVIFHKLQADGDDKSILQDEIMDYKRIVELKGRYIVGHDLLDLGMTIWTAHWLAETDATFKHFIQQTQSQLLYLFDEGYCDLPISRRLAFREYGTCLGIGCMASPDRKLLAYRDRIMETWEKEREDTPEELLAISEVMRAATIIPGAFRKGYLGEEEEL